MSESLKHLFFDLDDTVTLSRSLIDDDMHELMHALPHNIIVISGGQYSQINKQLRDVPAYRLGQNGNQAYHREGYVLWEERLLPHHEDAIRSHIEALKNVASHKVRNEHDLVEHRGSQISYSLIGHNEDTITKKSFDPDREKRLALLSEVPFESDEVEVRIGGTTCFDYFIKGKHKGFNIERLIHHEGWDKSHCLYFGDALSPGGNDEAVIGVINTVPVRDHRDTYNKLRELFM
jgi:phosphomannomutase